MKKTEKEEKGERERKTGNVAHMQEAPNKRASSGEQPGASLRKEQNKEKNCSEQPGASLQKIPEEDVVDIEREEGSLLAAHPGERQDPPLTEIPSGGGESDPPPVPAEEIEVRKHRIARKPVLPTKAEIEEHFPLHLQYRSWCKHCVAGKARSNQHVKKDESAERLGVTWNADYTFMGGEYNEDEDGMQASLVMYDDDKDSFLGGWC